MNSCVNEDMHDMCIGSQEALFMQVDGGRKKILRIFYALQLFIQLQRWQKKKKYRRLNMKFDAAQGYFKLTIIRGRKYFAFQGQVYCSCKLIDAQDKKTSKLFIQVQITKQTYILNYKIFFQKRHVYKEENIDPKAHV